MHRRAIPIAIFTLAAVLGGCGSDPPRPTLSVSVGQQLIDLKKAKDSGALSEREYESQKDKLIRSVE